MKTKFALLLFLCVYIFVTTSCATLFGGRSYNANVLIDSPDAQIIYKGMHVGYGNANISVPRRQADQLTITVRKDFCETQQFRYTRKSFREWAFLGTVVGWTGIVRYDDDIIIPLPLGIVVDGITGAWWKPDILENGVYKINYKNYNYLINYTGCDDLFKNYEETIEGDSKIKQD